MRHITITAISDNPETPAIGNCAIIESGGLRMPGVVSADIHIGIDEPVTATLVVLATVEYIDAEATYRLRDPLTDALLQPIEATHVLCECGMWWLVPCSIDDFARPHGHDGHTFEHREASVYAGVAEEASE